jgi:hypothetical protein
VDCSDVQETGLPMMNWLKWLQIGRVAVIALAAAEMAVATSVAASQEAKSWQPPAPAQESARSSPPDTTRYVRPAIPEDSMQTPVPRPGGPVPSRDGAKPSVPQPR